MRSSTGPLRPEQGPQALDGGAEVLRLLLGHADGRQATRSAPDGVGDGPDLVDLGVAVLVVDDGHAASSAPIWDSTISA